MSDVYKLLECKKGAVYKESQIKSYSFLKKYPDIEKKEGELAGKSRVVGDAALDVQHKMIEVGVRYHLSFREIAFFLLMTRLESGFNPDAAAGTTSAAGLAQYTNDTADEAIKDQYSKKLLGFTLYVQKASDRFDAEKGIFAMLLSYLICRNRAKKIAGSNYENYLYVFHHDGWSYKSLETAKSYAGYSIGQEKIIPFVGKVEAALKKNTEVSFVLSDAQGEPQPNKPYVAIVGTPLEKTLPTSAQKSQSIKLFKGATDGEGKTKPIHDAGVSEIIFSILNPYVFMKIKGVGEINKTEKHVVKKNETLSSIAKENNTSVADIAKNNKISDVNKIAVGDEIFISKPHIERIPDAGFIQSILAALKFPDDIGDVLSEYTRSHVVLPKGSNIQKNKIIKIKAAPVVLKPIDKKIIKDTHKTNDGNEHKTVELIRVNSTVEMVVEKSITKPELISAYTKNLINNIASDAGLTKVIITSGIRLPQKQAETMYENTKARGPSKAMSLYREPGQSVVRVFIEKEKAGCTKSEIIAAMKEKIEFCLENGHVVSKHCVPEKMYLKLNVIDVSYSRMNPSRRKYFEKSVLEAKSKGLISTFI